MTPREPLGYMSCSHCPINESSTNVHYTVYLAVMLQATLHTADCS